MRTLANTISLLVILLSSSWSVHAQQPADNTAPTIDPNLGARLFNGTYSVTFRGIRAGDIDFILRKANNHYVYESIGHPRGLARIFINNNVREATEFVVDNGVIKPQHYELDDGSRSTADDTRLDFDWHAGKARGIHEDKPIELPLAPDVQDRMSAQVVVMQLLVTGKPLGKIVFIDRDELKEYTYVQVRNEKIDTKIGPIATVVIESSRPQSDRVSRLWYAPSLNYLPVRGEQQRKGKVETVFEVQRLNP
jgi:hypothetical protein